MTSTLRKQIRQMKQGDRWRKLPIRVDHPDDPGLGYPYLIDGDDADGVPAPGYYHQIVQEGDCCTAMYEVGTTPNPWHISPPGHDWSGWMDIGGLSDGYQSPPDPLGSCWWMQFRFQIDVPIGTQLTGAAVLALYSHQNEPIGVCNSEWRLLPEASRGSYQTDDDCAYNRAADRQTPLVTTPIVNAFVEAQWGFYTLTTLVQAFIDDINYMPDNWLGLVVRWQPPTSVAGFMSRDIKGYRDVDPPTEKLLAPILQFPWGEEVPGQAGTRLCVPTEAGRIHQIRMEKLGVE